MDHGIFAHVERLADTVALLGDAEPDGIASVGLSRGFGHDTLTVIGTVATESATGSTDALRWVFATEGAGQEGAPT